MIACLAAIAGLLIGAIVRGAPSGAVGRVEIAAFFVVCLVFIHQLVVHVLPIANGRDHREPGISERGVAYGVSPMPGWFNRIDIHLRPKRSRRRDD